MARPPVGSVCPHDVEGLLTCPPHVRTMQWIVSITHPNYRRGDDHWWIMYHPYYLDTDFDEVMFCGKPLLRTWHHFVRYCFNCDKQFSNPWVPVCEKCWPEFDTTDYPSYAYVIGLDRQRLPMEITGPSVFGKLWEQ